MNALFFVVLVVVAWSGLACFFLCKREEAEESCNCTSQGLGYDCTYHERISDHIGEYVVDVPEVAIPCEPWPELTPEDGVPFFIAPTRYYRGDAHPTVGGLIWSSSGAGPNGSPSGRWVTPEELAAMDLEEMLRVGYGGKPKQGFITVAQKELADGKITYQQYAFRLFMDHATDRAGDAYSDCAEMSGNFQYGEYDQDDYDDFEVMCDRQEVLEGRQLVIQEVNLMPYVMGSGKDKRMFMPSYAFHILFKHAEKLAHRAHQNITLWHEENEVCMPEDDDYTNVDIERHDIMRRVCELNSGTIICQVNLKHTPDIGFFYWNNEGFKVGLPSEFMDWSQLRRDQELESIAYNYVEYMRSEGGRQVEAYVAQMEWFDFEVAYYNSEQ